MYNPEEALELQQIAKTLHNMINEYEEKYGVDEDKVVESFRNIVDFFDQLANDYMNSTDDAEKEAIRKQAFSQLNDVAEILNLYET